MGTRNMKLYIFLMFWLSANVFAQQPLNQQVTSAVKHPESDDALLAILLDGQLVEVFLESQTYNLLTADGEGYLDGNLGESQFNMPTAIVELTSGKYAISDTINQYIRQLNWQDKTVTTVSDKFSFGGSGQSNPKHMVRDGRNEDVVYVSSFNDDCKSSVVKVNLADRSTDEREMSDYCVVGMVMSLYHDTLYLLTGELHAGHNDWPDQHYIKVRIATIDTKTFDHEVINATVDAENTKGELDLTSSSMIIYSGNQMNHRQFGLSQVGNHLLAVLGTGSPFVDFDFSYSTVSVSLINLQKVDITEDYYNLTVAIGPIIYTKNPSDPAEMYTWYYGKFQPLKSFAICDKKTQARPTIWSSSWITNSGYSCPYGNKYLIESIAVHNLSNNADSCQVQNCYSVCKKQCEDDIACVAFQCDSVLQVCSLYSCAAAPTEYNRQHTCYRMADLVYAPLIL